MMEEEHESSFTLKIGREFDYKPFKNERYVFLIKIAKILGTVIMGIADITIVVYMTLNSLMNELLAWTLVILTIIFLAGTHCVSEQVPTSEKEEEKN